jgi:hypothetical protein
MNKSSKSKHTHTKKKSIKARRSKYSSKRHAVRDVNLPEESTNGRKEEENREEFSAEKEKKNDLHEEETNEHKQLPLLKQQIARRATLGPARKARGFSGAFNLHEEAISVQPRPRVLMAEKEKEKEVKEVEEMKVKDVFETNASNEKQRKENSPSFASSFSLDFVLDDPLVDYIDENNIPRMKGGYRKYEELLVRPLPHGVSALNTQFYLSCDFLF